MDLDKLEELAESAIPHGVWRHSPWFMEEGASAVRNDRYGIICTTASDSTAAFIAAFNPAVALELIAEIKRLRRVNDDYLHIIHEHQEQLAKYEQATPSRPLKRWAKGWQQCAKCDALHIELPDDSAFMRAHREAEHRKNQEGGASGAVPDGWQVVPKELRQEMDDAMYRAMDLGSNQHLWDAALAVAPLPPALSADQEKDQE